MNRKLILSNSGFPGKFESSSVPFPSIPALKKQYIEEKIIDAINIYNPKLKISAIDYVANIEEQFPHLDFFGQYIGIIVEDIEITELEQDEYNERQYYVWEFNNKYYARKIIIHVFIADLQSVGRNTFCQAFFPELVDFMHLYQSSPSFSIANCPVYFINFESGNYPDSIVKQTAGLIASGIEYIDVFNENDNLSQVPKNIKHYLNKFEDGFTTTTATMLLYSSDFFEIDVLNKITKIKTDKLVLGEYLEIKNGNHDFKGSSEKFYWMEILPIVFLSIENGYKIDYTLLEDFYTTNQPSFSPRSSKIERFLFLIQFIEKIIFGVNK
jgi:hypothetical protein